jgi:hypothetical protein
MLTQYEKEYFPKIETPEDVFTNLDKYVRDFDPAKANSIQKAIKNNSTGSHVKLAYEVSKQVYEDFRMRASAMAKQRHLAEGYQTDDPETIADMPEEDIEKFIEIQQSEEDKYNLNFLQDIYWKAEDILFAEGEKYMLKHIDSPEAKKIFQKSDMKKEDVKNIFYNVLHYHPNKRKDLLSICLRANI